MATKHSLGSCTHLTLLAQACVVLRAIYKIHTGIQQANQSLGQKVATSVCPTVSWFMPSPSYPCVRLIVTALPDGSLKDKSTQIKPNKIALASSMVKSLHSTSSRGSLRSQLRLFSLPSFRLSLNRFLLLALNQNHSVLSQALPLDITKSNNILTSLQAVNPQLAWNVQIATQPVLAT